MPLPQDIGTYISCYYILETEVNLPILKGIAVNEYHTNQQFFIHTTIINLIDLKENWTVPLSQKGNSSQILTEESEKKTKTEVNIQSGF